MRRHTRLVGADPVWSRWHARARSLKLRDDQLIQPLVDAISPKLNDHNLFVRACPCGRDVGNENEIRVFSARYIKGLEFEAVFVLRVDGIAEKYAELFTQISYVGATRATRYLGLSCADLRPEQIAGLRTHFQGSTFARMQSAS